MIDSTTYEYVLCGTSGISFHPYKMDSSSVDHQDEYRQVVVLLYVYFKVGMSTLQPSSISSWIFLYNFIALHFNLFIAKFEALL